MLSVAHAIEEKIMENGKQGEKINSKYHYAWA